LRRIAREVSERNGLGLAALDGKLYATGGAEQPDGSSLLSTVEVLDASGGNWRPAPNMSAAHDWGQLAALDGKLYAAGGDGGTYA
jgi:hypothetical protein